MPEQDLDRLEEFFRKASLKADVPFNEEDWKKLEARLEAEDASTFAGKTTSGRIFSALVVAGLLLLLTGGWWLNTRYGIIDLKGRADTSAEQISNQNEPAVAGSEHDKAPDAGKSTDSGLDADADNGQQTTPETSLQPEHPKDETRTAPSIPVGVPSTDDVAIIEDEGALDDPDKTTGKGEPVINETANAIRATPGVTDPPTATITVGNEKIFRELISHSPANAEKIKQKANVDLPGAEEGDTGEAETIVAEEDASVKHVTTPRLSLLLSFAPDFSSTSNQYAAPGKAFGALLHYHLLPRWSVAAGVIKNNKQYTGDGEDYQPPKGYWKYYTNGVIPYSIDGSCSVLEFPVMLQYTIAGNGKHRWLAGAGTSSYLMLSESYRYNFEEPNPGAREGWDSKGRSRFYFNMVNITLGYEHQVLPGLMIGLEPYVKIPIETIGWSNIKLFSTGASFTLRYKIIGRKNISTPIRSRGPD